MPIKTEAKLEAWWLNTLLSEGTLHIYGQLYGDPSIKEGQFVVFEVMRADMTNRIVETATHYLKLGEFASLRKINLERG